MKLRCAALLCAVAYCALVVSAEQESKYNEIIKLLSDSDQQLKPAAQSYSASVVDPNDYSSSSSGYSRNAERSRYTPSSSSSNAKNNKDDDDDKKLEEDEEDKKPDRLALLLAESKFACDSLKNGYYADETVGCQVFHYCVDGVKHSWQCPENTVFHQIHLNCVPNTQDICRESSKFHVVNDYLHKELNERGPNNTILYSQRFYPEGFDFSGGDTVTQIFQAQAAAALQRARERDQESADYEEEPQSRPRSRPKQTYTPSTQAVRPQQASRQSYKPASRPIPATYAPQPAPTKRPVTYTTEAYTPPSYTESSNDDYSSDYSPSSGSASASSGASPSFSSSSNLGSSSYNSGASVASSYSPSSQSSPSSFSSSSHSSHSQPSSSFRPSSASRPSSYPSRSLGIPIASFRVAPSSGSGYSSVGAQASTIQEVNVPVNYNQGGYYF